MEQMLLASGESNDGDDDYDNANSGVSKLLRTETVRRILLEKKSEADEDAVSSLMEQNERLGRDLEKQLQRIQTLEAERAEEREAARKASEQATSGAVEEEKRVWAERTRLLEDEVTFLREQVEMANASTGEADELSAELASLRYELESKESECNDYKSQADASSRQVRNLGEEIRTLREEVDQLATAKMELEKATSNTPPLSQDTEEDLRDTATSLREMLDDKTRLCSESATRIDDLEGKLREAERTASSLAAETEKRHNMLTEQIELQNKELEEVRLDRDGLKDVLQSREEAEEQLKIELQSCKEANERMQSELDGYADKLESTTKHHLDQLNDNLSRLKELEDINVLLEQEKNDLEMDVVNMSTTQEALDYKNAELEVAKGENSNLLCKMKEREIMFEEATREREDMYIRLKQEQERSRDLNTEVSAIGALAEEIDKLKSENERLTLRCKELEQDVDRMQAEASMNEAEVSALESEFEDVAAQRDKLQAQYDNLKEKNQEDDGLSSNRDLSMLQIEISSLNERNNALTSQNSALQEKVKQSEAVADERDTLAKAVATMTCALDQARSTIESLQDQASDVVADLIAEKDGEVSQLSLEIESLRNDLSKACSQRDNAESHAEDVEKDRNRIKVMLQELEDEMIRVQDDKSTEIERMKTQQEESIARLRTENELLRSQHDSRLEDIEDQMKQTLSNLERKEAEVQEKDSVIKQLQEERSSYKSEASGLEEQRRDAEATSENENVRLVQETTELRASIEALEEELAASNEDREQLGLENEELFVQLGLLRQMNEEERNSFESQLAERDALHSSESRDESQSLRVQVDELTALCSERAREIAEKDSLIGEIRSELESLRLNEQLGTDEDKTAGALEDDHDAKISEVEERLAEKETEIQHLTGGLADRDLRLADAEERILSLETDIASRDAELNALKKQVDDIRATTGNDAAALKTLLASKNEELSACNAELESMRSDLDICRNDLAENEEVMDRLANVSRNISASLFEISSKDKAESVEFMRSQIVSLATAVENAEISRAEALDRIVAERQSHAESLRKLGDSVKRFYSALVSAD